MKRLANALLAALLLLGAGGCAQAPESQPNRPGEAPWGKAPVTVPVPADSQIAPTDLTEGDKRLINLIAQEDVFLFHFKADPSLRNADFWIEHYEKGEKRPDIGLGGIGGMENEPLQGDIMIKTPSATDTYSVELAVDSRGLARLKSDPISIGPASGHASQQLREPTAIAENAEIVLRVDVYNKDTLYSPSMADGYLDPAFMEQGLMKEMNHVFIVKCRFSKTAAWESRKETQPQTK